jgi:(p)ppGpp synthase/HD superfamily hydrolase
MNIVEIARNVAVKAHGDQKYGDQPYVVHLDEVAAYVQAWGSTAQILAYLHDTLEDTQLEAQIIEDAFGTDVRRMVEMLTDPPGRNRRQRKELLHSRLAKIKVQDDERLVLVVKAADRLANVRACIAEKKDALLSMYKREHVAFSRAVFRPGLTHIMIEELERLLA